MDWITLTRREVEDDALPPVCIHCGGPATERHNKTFHWEPPWVNWLYFAGFLPGVIVAGYCTRKMRVSLPVCGRHRAPSGSRKVMANAGWLLLPLLFAGLGAGAVALLRLTPLLNEHEIQAQQDKAEWEQLDKEYEPVRSREKEDPKQLAQKQDHLRKVRNRLELSLAEATQHRNLTYYLALGIGAGVGLLIWFVWLLLSFRGRRWLSVQDITGDGITLVGLADPFVKAVRDQRPFDPSRGTANL